jgi:hypothetical protein
MEGLWARFRHLPALEIGRSSASRWRIPTIAQGDVLKVNTVLSEAGAPKPQIPARTQIPKAVPDSAMPKRVLAGRCFGGGRRNMRENPLILKPFPPHLHIQLLRIRSPFIPDPTKSATFILIPLNPHYHTMNINNSWQRVGVFVISPANR